MLLLLFITKMERKLEAAQESIGDHQQTILKFRDLVAKLQVRLKINFKGMFVSTKKKMR